MQAHRSSPTWWLNPIFLFASINLTFACAALLLPQSSYELWQTSKYFAPHHMWILLGAVAAFSLAFWTGSFFRKSMSIQLSEPWLHLVFRCSCLIAAAAYVLWTLNALRYGLSTGMVIEVLQGSRGAANQLKKVFETIPGVTTLTQLGIVACLIFPILRNRQTVDWLLVLGVVGLGLGRAVALSERLALVELLVPLCLLALYNKIWDDASKRPIWSHLLLPLGFAMSLVLFFAFTEYFRSWQYYKQTFASFPEFVIWRISSYYVTALNNGAMWIDLQQTLPAPYFSLEFLWEFPLVDRSPFAYDKLFLVRPKELNGELLANFATAELNNPSGILIQYVDFGIVGFFGFWFAVGLVAARVFNAFLAGQQWGMLLFPVVMLGILESPRVPYLTSTRVLPVYLAFLAIVLVFGRFGSAENELVWNIGSDEAADDGREWDSIEDDDKSANRLVDMQDDLPDPRPSRHNGNE